MFSVQKWKCLWSLLATVASLIVLVSLVHLFLFPVFPYFDYFSARQAQYKCVPINETAEQGDAHGWENTQQGLDLDHRFPSDLHNAVVYHNAPCKAEIGRWLSACDAIAREVNITETIGSRHCKDDCSGQGVCNHELGLRRCFHRFSGEECSERLNLSCNYPKTPELPYGRWVVSLCSAHCDTTRAMCFCGEGTKYPNRPLAEACGFQVNLPSEPGGPKLTDWAKADLENIFTTNGSKPGWCNVDPDAAYASKVQFKEECDCKYYGVWGRFCEVPIESVCINQCSGHGHCHGGFCQCYNGWYGTDCSIPSVVSPTVEWPKWLQPAHVDIPSNELTGRLVNLNAAVRKKRPLIYVYDLPPEFNSLLLEGRHFRLKCVNRIYDDRNATLWTDQLYGSQMALYESILASPH